MHSFYYVACTVTELADRYNWLRLPLWNLRLYLTRTLTDQVRGDILSWISRVPVPAEFGAAKVPRRKMDEVGYMCFHGALLILYVSSLNIFIWGVTLCCHAACKNFAGLFAARFVLGICEGSFMPGFMIVNSMFYTRSENTSRVGYCCEDGDQPPLTPNLTF